MQKSISNSWPFFGFDFEKGPDKIENMNEIKAEKHGQLRADVEILVKDVTGLSDTLSEIKNSLDKKVVHLNIDEVKQKNAAEIWQQLDGIRSIPIQDRNFASVVTEAALLVKYTNIISHAIKEQINSIF